MAVLSAPVPLVGTDTRSWTAASADSLAVALDLPGITATVSYVAPGSAVRQVRGTDRGGAG